MKEVVLLGAGFSRAVSPRMPLLNELGDRVVEALYGMGRYWLDRFGGNVEEYLTFIGANQPWLTDEENLQQQARFSETVTALRDVIVQAERAAAAEGLPEWLERVAWQWSRDRVSILTFNYDTLLERPLQLASGAGALSDLYVAPLGRREPAGASLYLGADAPTKPAPELYKLHGSVNWLHGGDLAPVTDPLILDEREHDAPRPPRYDRIYGGLRPFLIPPTSVKNRYYDRVGVREQWKLASHRLEKCDRLTVIGYSMPATDVGTSSFLRTSLNPDAHVSVVDLSPNAADRFATVLQRPTCWYDGLAAWVSDQVASLVEWWVTNETADASEGHVRINGEDQSNRLPFNMSGSELDDWVRARFGNLLDVEHNVPLKGLLLNRAWSLPAV